MLLKTKNMREGGKKINGNLEDKVVKLSHKTGLKGGVKGGKQEDK